jgi:hypothetical protein
MADYVLTKDANRQTGELPDRLTIVLPRKSAEWLTKQLLLKLFDQPGDTVKLDLLGRVEPATTRGVEVQ